MVPESAREPPLPEKNSKNASVQLPSRAVSLKKNPKQERTYEVERKQQYHGAEIEAAGSRKHAPNWRKKWFRSLVNEAHERTPSWMIRIKSHPR
jgi:hypothetical protein